MTNGNDAQAKRVVQRREMLKSVTKAAAGAGSLLVAGTVGAQAATCVYTFEEETPVYDECGCCMWYILGPSREGMSRSTCWTTMGDMEYVDWKSDNYPNGWVYSDQLAPCY